MKYRVSGLVFDTDGEDLDLPDEMEVELDDEAEPELELADAISDKTGYLVLDNFHFEEINPSSPKP